MDTIENQIAKTLREAAGVEVEVTIRGTTDSLVEMTISGSQYDAMKGAGFMVNHGLATFTEAVSYIEDPDRAYFYLVG